MIPHEPVSLERVRELCDWIVTQKTTTFTHDIVAICDELLSLRQGVVRDERLDQRMSREKLESAIAWFSGEAKPSNRRVSRGDLRSMLLELQSFRENKNA